MTSVFLELCVIVAASHSSHRRFKKKYTRRNYYTSRKDQYLNTIKTDGVRVQHNKYLMRGILQQPLGVLQALFVADA